MRSCDETLELISAALDGALTANEQAELDEHLSRCPACSALFDDLKNLREASAELEDVPAPAGFAGRVMDAIAADPAQEPTDNVVPFPVKKRSRTPWKGWAATAAVVAVVALGAVALPGPLGGSSKFSTGATADCAAPAQAENNSAALFAEDEAAEADSFGSATSGDSNAANGTARMDAGGSAEPGSAPAESAAGTEKDEKAAEYSGAGVYTAVPDEDVAAIGGAAGAESVFIGLTAGDVGEAGEQEETDTGNTDSSPSSAAFCGTITLTGGSLPEGLEDWEATENESGNRIYVVPADFFFSCLNTLEKEQPGSFSYEAGQEDGSCGLIVVDDGDAR